MAIYMKFGSVAGQVTTDGYKDWIEVHSLQHGVSRVISSATGGAQREGSNPSISEISITKLYDKASAKIYEDSLAGAFNTKVEFKFTSTTKSKVDAFLAYELTDAGVSTYTVSSSGDNPVENISINFAKIMITPSPLDASGSPKKGDVVTYDLQKHVKS